MSESSESFGFKLNALLQEAGLDPVERERAKLFQDYLSLVIRWNAQINLTSVRDEAGILTRHFVESIACARALPVGIGTSLDYGSGAGFPGIPIAICRPGVSVTLAESQGKRAAFLQETVRILGISAKVHCDRAETLTARFDCVTLRAVDRMPRAVEAAARLVVPGGWLALMTTRSALAGLQAASGADFSWGAGGGHTPLPGGNDRILALGSRGVSSSV
jgi:16S rRNA (guanine527-N7)-methyltransferase